MRPRALESVEIAALVWYLISTVSNYPEIFKSLLKRIVPAAAFALLGGLLVGNASGGWSASPYLLFGAASLITAAVILAYPLAALLAEPAGKLFYSGDRFARPVPLYSIAEAERAKGHYEDAMDRFETIAREYPGEVKPYIAMIEIAIIDLKDADRARNVFYRGLSSLRKEDDQEVLRRMYGAISSRLNAKPSN